MILVVRTFYHVASLLVLTFSYSLGTTFSSGLYIQVLVLYYYYDGYKVYVAITNFYSDTSVCFIV